LQYEKFWINYTDVPVLWISQLMSILSMSALLGETIASLVSHQGADRAQREAYAKAAAQLLVLGDYEKPQKFVVEALFLYAMSKAVASIDPTGEVNGF
jgi:hypothetical protein